MQQTSIDSYRKLNRNKTESERQKILDFLQAYPTQKFCDSQIAYTTGIPVNIVESRRGDLHKRGDIVSAGTFFNPKTKRHVQGWRAKQP
jgi:hypothetical protein